MVGLMHTLPPARPTGLSRSVGRPPRTTLALAAALALGTALVWVGPWALALTISIGLITLAWAAVATAKIGGQTGDILGATQQLAEITALLTFLALAA
jgi:adenosylcobinamide-GDP ribazoletransferase